MSKEKANKNQTNKQKAKLQHKSATKLSITLRLRTDLELSHGLTTATQVVLRDPNLPTYSKICVFKRQIFDNL